MSPMASCIYNHVGVTYQVIYGRSSGPKFVREVWVTVLYHDK